MPEHSSSTEHCAEPRHKPWFLYLLECLDGSLYTGITTDVNARYAVHTNGKGARYTRSHPPARLLGFVEYPDRSSASKAEYQIKQLKPPEKRIFFADASVQSPRANV
ncbi:MAG: GIY-YIG nuclease family protein [Betaproteobacteria bacterium]